MADNMPGTFEFPITCGRDRVAGRRVDGQTFTIPMSQIRDLVPLLDSVKTLCINPMFRDVRAFTAILASPMPRLENLRIDTYLYDPARPRQRIHSPPTYTLRAANFPALKKLVVRDTFVNLEPALCRNLRFLHLERSERGGSQQLSLAAFLQIVSSCPLLKHLYVDNYLDVATAPGAPLPPVLSLAAGLPRLTNVGVSDQPHIVGKILSHLVIPAHVDVVAVGYVNANHHVAFRAMLPDDRNKLEILHRATEIRLLDSTAGENFNGTILTGAFDGGSAGLDLELRPVPNTAFGPPDHRDSTRLHAMLCTLDIYQGSPVTTLKVEGDLQAIPKEAWAEAFDRFPELQTLELTNNKREAALSFKPLLEGLLHHSRVRPGLVCPRLAHVVLSANAGMAAAWLAETLPACFGERERAGAPPLRVLNVGMHVPPAAQWDAATERRYKGMMARVARHAVVTFQYEDMASSEEDSD